MASIEKICRSLLRLIQYVLHRLFFGAIRYPITTCLATIALFLFAAFSLPKTQILLDFSDYLSSNTESTRNTAELRSLFGNKRSLFVLLRNGSDKPITAEQYCRVDSWIWGLKRRFDNKIDPVSPFDMRYPWYKSGVLWYMPYVPLTCGNATPRNFEDQRSLTTSPWREIFTNRNSSDLLVELNLAEAPMESRFGTFDYALVKKLDASLGPAFAGSGLSAELTGQSVFFWYKLDAAAKDRQFNLAILAVFLVIVRLLFGTWRGAFLLVGNLVIMGVTLFGLMAATRTPVDVVSNALFPVVCVAVVQDYLFLSHRRFSKPNEHWTSCFCRMLTPTFLTSFTTILGFGTLIVSELANIRAFAFWAAFGAFYEWVLTLLVFPAFLKIFPRFQQWTAPTGRFSLLAGAPRRWLEALSARSLPRWMVVALACLVIPSVFCGFFLQIHDEPEKVFSASHPLRMTTSYLHDSRGWTNEASVVIRSEAPQELRDRILATLKRDANVAIVHNPWDVEAELSANLPPLISKLVQSDFELSSIYKRYYSDKGDALVRLFLKSSNTRAIAEVRNALARLCSKGECFLSSPLSSYEEVLQQILPTLLESFGLSLLLIGTVLANLVVATSERRHLLSVVFSSVWGLLLMLGVFYLLDEKISHITCVVASIFVGIAGDNIIHYLLSKGSSNLEAGFRERGSASICITGTMILAISPYFFSEFIHSQRLALLMTIGFLLILVGDLWLLRGLTRLSRQKS